MKVSKITTTNLLDKLDDPLVKVSIKNSNTIASVEKEKIISKDGKITKENKYIIYVNNNLKDELIMYFLFHELSHILVDNFDENSRANFFMKFEEVDIPALQAYLDHNFDPNIISNSELFSEKMEEPRFNKMIKKAQKS